MVFFKSRLHWLRKNIDHGAGVVAYVDATSSHKNQKLLQQTSSATCFMTMRIMSLQQRLRARRTAGIVDSRTLLWTLMTSSAAR